MLVLTLLTGDAVVCEVGGVRVRVVVTSIDRGRVRLGCDAPGAVPFWREELESVPGAVEYFRARAAAAVANTDVGGGGDEAPG